MHFLTGTVGIGAIQGIDTLPTPTPTSEVVKIAIQVIIGIVTLWKMFKKPKENINNQNQE